MKDRAFPAFDLNCTIHYTFTHQLKTEPFWHASVPFQAHIDNRQILR